MTTTWLDVPAKHPFGLANLPYGVFSTEGRAPRVGVRIGDWVLDAGARGPAGIRHDPETSGCSPASTPSSPRDGRPGAAPGSG